MKNKMAAEEEEEEEEEEMNDTFSIYFPLEYSTGNRKSNESI